MEYRKETHMGDWSEETVVEGSVFEVLDILHFEWKKDVVSEVTDNKGFTDPKAKPDDIARAIGQIMADKRR